MTNNQLKIIACISMAIDHIGVILFPGIELLRIIGRIAMPIFAFLIAEGCRHTHNRKKYFLEIFALAVLCQLFYTGEEIINGSFYEVYLNILFTFSLSILICFAVLSKRAELILLSFASAFFLTDCLGKIIGFPVIFDYGFAAAILPAFACFGEGKKRLLYFSIGLVIFNLIFSSQMSISWWSLLAIPVIFFYNGERGNVRFKYWFYLFYPVHLAVIYGISELIY